MSYTYFPNAGITSDALFDLLVQLLPRGADALYGLLRKSGDVYNLIAGIADGAKAYVTDGIATIRAEVSPLTANLKLPEYESMTGLSQTAIAIGGSTQQRRNQVISKLREQGAATVNNVVAILAPLLGMIPGNVQVIESNQAAITTAHTYTNSSGASIGSNSSTTQLVAVNDGGNVSDAGAQVTITITSTNPEQLSFTLTTPGGGAYSMPAGSIPAGSVTSVAFKVSFTASAGASFNYGQWAFQISTGAAACTLVSWALFVEGIAQGQDTGGARFWYGVYADPAHLGEAGTSANFAAARAALTRISPAHTVGTLLQSISGAYPGVTSGATSAIPNESLPSLPIGHASLSMPYSSNVGVPALTFALPVWVPSDVTQVRIKIDNIDVTSTNGNSMAGMSIGIGTSNGTNGYSGSPTVYSNVTLPGDGSYYLTPWTPITRGGDGKIIVAYSVPNGSTLWATATGVTWGLRAVGTAQVNPLPGGMTANNSQGCRVEIQYYTNAKKVVVLGDSLAVGYDASVVVTVPDDAFYRLGPDHGYAVDDSGIPGSTLAQWGSNLGVSRFTAEQLYGDSYCIIEVGINDLPTYTLGQYQSAITTLAAALKAVGAIKVFVMTPTPSTTYAAYEALRQTWLTWLRAGGIANVDGIIDADAAVRDPANHAQLLAGYNSGDGTHWNAAGHGQVEPLIFALIG